MHNVFGNYSTQKLYARNSQFSQFKSAYQNTEVNDFLKILLSIHFLGRGKGWHLLLLVFLLVFQCGFHESAVCLSTQLVYHDQPN